MSHSDRGVSKIFDESDERRDGCNAMQHEACSILAFHKCDDLDEAAGFALLFTRYLLRLRPDPLPHPVVVKDDVHHG